MKELEPIRERAVIPSGYTPEDIVWTYSYLKSAKKQLAEIVATF